MTPNQTKQTLPLISIGIPTYNGAKRISKAINSVFQQSYPNIEIVISDNASTDDTETVCQSYMQIDDRIRYFRQPRNMGLAFNFEYVLREAKGKYFIWLSDDDEMYPEILDRYVDYLEANAAYSLVCGEIDYWKDDRLTDRERKLNFTQEKPLNRSISYYSKVKEGALIYGMMRTEAAQKVRFKSILGGDWHFVAAMAYQGKIRQLPFVGYVKHPGVGVSRNFRNYAKIMGEAPVWGYLPYTKMAGDAFREICYVSPIYRKSIFPARLIAGLIAGMALWGHYNLLIVPRIMLGRLLRLLGIKTPKERKLQNMQDGN